MGAYFITICSHGRRPVFGRIVDGTMQLSLCGRMVESCWVELPHHYPNAIVDSHIVMPNHTHGIIILKRPNSAQGMDAECIPTSHSLGEIVRGFKALSTRQINEAWGTMGVPVWQRGYYEHVIRGEKSLNAIREYIENNLVNWGFDPDNLDKARDR